MKTMLGRIGSVIVWTWLYAVCGLFVFAGLSLLLGDRSHASDLFRWWFFATLPAVFIGAVLAAKEWLSKQRAS